MPKGSRLVVVVINYKGGRAEEDEVKFMDPTTDQHLANQV